MYASPGDGGIAMRTCDAWFTVGDIKQYAYCPRIPYFRHVMRVPFHRSYSMQVGKQRHVQEELLERRRSFRKFGGGNGRKHFEVYLQSERLRLTGKLDLLIELHHGSTIPDENASRPSTGVKAGRDVREWIPVEIKVSDRQTFGKNAVYQLVAYGLLVEESYGAPVREGWLYNVDTKRIQVVTFTAGARQYVGRILSRLHQIVAAEMFLPPWSRKRCVHCEFRGYCNDLS